MRRVLGHCLSCRKRNGPLGKQLMAELPPERTASDKPPFAATGVDYFGPFLVKIGRCKHKQTIRLYLPTWLPGQFISKLRAVQSIS